MKRHFALLACTIAIVSFGHAQGCLPEGLELHSQWEVDAFPTNHPGCTQIEGFVQIGPSNEAGGGGITDLTPLSQITTIDGNLLIDFTLGLASLNGLENLTSVGGDLEIQNTYVLTDLTGLANLTMVGGMLEIYRNYDLPSLNGLGSVIATGGALRIAICPELTDLQGLEGLMTVGGNLSVDDNSILESTNGLAPSSLGGGLYIRDNPLLTDLSVASGLTNIGTYLRIQNNASLSSLNELSGITSLSTYLDVEGMPLLTDLSPLAGIDPNSITLLYLEDLPGVSDCALANICAYLTLPTANASIANNAAGCASVAEVEAACLTTSIIDVQSMAFDVFPNPTNGIITLLGKFEGKDAIRVLDTAGRLLYEQLVQGNTTTPLQLDLGSLKSGTYVVRLNTQNGVLTRMIVRE